MGMIIFQPVDSFIQAFEKSHVVRMQLLNDTGIDKRQLSQPDKNPAEQNDSEVAGIALHPRVFHRQNRVKSRSQPHDPFLVNRPGVIHKTPWQPELKFCLK